MKHIQPHPNLASIFCSTLAPFALVALLLSPGNVNGQGMLTLANPHWNITLTDAGYSDFLLDNTPGFEGREYLCGEWGGAVGYTVGSTNVAPQWFEPHFSYPDWTTDSQFGVKSSLAQIGLNADNLPIAESIITNSHLQVTLRHEMIDTIVGIPMGQTARVRRRRGHVHQQRPLRAETDLHGEEYFRRDHLQSAIVSIPPQPARRARRL